MRITKEHVNRLRQIKRRFLSDTEIPRRNRWKPWTNNRIWLEIFKQVIVVGRADRVDKFENRKLQALVSYSALSKIRDKKRLEERIHKVLRQIGARYASRSISKCRKTQALAHNFQVVSKFEGGPRGLLNRLAQFRGANAERRRIKYIMKIFKYFGSKSARDFLIGIGMVRQAIALDVRLQRVLRKVGIKVPVGIGSSEGLYDKVEAELLDKVCKPLRISGAQFDRMIFGHYREIDAMKF